MRRGAACVLSSSGRAPTIWRLDVREDSNDGGAFVSTAASARWWPGRKGSRQRLGHYISAGGLRQHRWSTADDVATSRQWLAVRIMLAFVAVWLIFRFVPCE
jgi:hypothetical protein